MGISLMRSQVFVAALGDCGTGAGRAFIRTDACSNLGSLMELHVFVPVQSEAGLSRRHTSSTHNSPVETANITAAHTNRPQFFGGQVFSAATDENALIGRLVRETLRRQRCDVRALVELRCKNEVEAGKRRPGEQSHLPLHACCGQCL